MILCDLCDQAKECLQKEIEGREFDICADCWRLLDEKLRGKGRVKKRREMVFLTLALNGVSLTSTALDFDEDTFHAVRR